MGRMRIRGGDKSDQTLHKTPVDIELDPVFVAHKINDIGRGGQARPAQQFAPEHGKIRRNASLVILPEIMVIMRLDSDKGEKIAPALLSMAKRNDTKPIPTMRKAPDTVQHSMPSIRLFVPLFFCAAYT